MLKLLVVAADAYLEQKEGPAHYIFFRKAAANFEKSLKSYGFCLSSLNPNSKEMDEHHEAHPLALLQASRVYRFTQSPSEGPKYGFLTRWKMEGRTGKEVLFSTHHLLHIRNL